MVLQPTFLVVLQYLGWWWGRRLRFSEYRYDGGGLSLKVLLWGLKTLFCQYQCHRGGGIFVSSSTLTLEHHLKETQLIFLAAPSLLWMVQP